jgi:CO/xanthine dehydrogenase Mo-binding subunit
VFSVWSWGKGDVEAGFAEADLIVEGTYKTPVVHHAYLEPNSSLVWIDEEERIQVWASNKTPYDLRRQLSDALDVNEDQIIVNAAFIGGDFGGKGSPMDVPLCYFLAKHSGQPVLMVMDYVEEFMAGDPRHASITRFKTGVKNDGSMTAHQAEVIFNSGAYGGFKPAVNLPGAMSAGGLYKVPHAKIESKLVYTHTIHGGHMRSPGEPQTSFAMESHIDEIAYKLGISPLDYRRQNLIEEGDSMASGLTFHDVRIRETLEAAVDASEYLKPKPPHVGRGIGVGERPAGGGQGQTSVVMDPNGGVTLYTVLFDQGSGANTSLRQIVAEELGLPMDRIQYVVGTTAAAPYDSGLGAARATRIESDSTNKAVVEVREKVTRLGAEIMGWAEERTVLIGENLVNQESGETVPWKDVLQRIGDAVTGTGSVDDMSHPHSTGFVAQIAEVSVDPETGQVKLLNFTTAHDVGTVLNPIGHQGQINGGVIMGVGFGLMEELKTEDGRVSTLSFGDVKVPTIADIPKLKTVLVHSDGGSGPYNVKSIAESPNIPVAGAIANAIRDAIGLRIAELPLTAEKIYKSLKRPR